VLVTATSTLASGIAGRYATAVFELATEADALPEVERDLAALEEALAASADLRGVIASPLLGRDEQGAAMTAVANAMGLGTTVTNLLGLMAAKRRLFVLPAVIEGVRALASAARGEVTAEVTAAAPLTTAQQANLAAELRRAVGKDVAMTVSVDPALIGGLVVKVGSRMIDTSIRAKLARLQNLMKEVQ
jgi:F-type H+-transporting ATPase subunit delta